MRGRRPPVSVARACGLFHARMQLNDEGAIVMVLRRHQGRGLPAGREDGDASITCAFKTRAFDVGAKPPRLHRHRTVRQPDRRNPGIGPYAGSAADVPRQAVVGQFEPMRRADQRRLVGVTDAGDRRIGPSAPWAVPLDDGKSEDHAMCIRHAHKNATVASAPRPVRTAWSAPHLTTSARTCGPA